MTELILIGESNPYGADPAFALYPLPKNSAGARLQRIVFGLRRHRYVELPRYNLCGGKWRMAEARARAAAIRAKHVKRGPMFMGEKPDPAVFVLLGRKVAAAFNLAARPPFEVIRQFAHDLLEPERDAVFVLLPHPSGRNAANWGPANVKVARKTLQVFRPDLPWGEVDP